jgi:hypothetical protein
MTTYIMTTVAIAASRLMRSTRISNRSLRNPSAISSATRSGEIFEPRTSRDRSPSTHGGSTSKTLT